MNREVSLAVLIAGIALIIYGLGMFPIADLDAFWARRSALNERIVALLCAGALFAVLGGYGASRSTR